MKFSKSKVFYKVYGINLLCSLLFMSIISVVAIRVGNQFIFENIVDYNQERLLDASRELDESIRDLQEDAFSLLDDPNILGLLMTSQEEYEKPLTILEIINKLGNMVWSDDCIEEIYLLDFQREIVVSHTGKYPLEENQIHGNYQLKEFYFRELENNRQYEFVLYLEPMLNSKQIAIMFIVNKQVFDSQIDFYSGNEASYFVHQDEFYHVMGNDQALYRESIKTIENGYQNVEVDGQSVIIYKELSPLIGMEVAVIQDQSEMIAASEKVAKITLMVSFAFMLAMTIIMYGVSLYFYRPLKTLSTHVKDMVGDEEQGEDDNEYQMIFDVMKELHHKSHEDKQKYMKAVPTLIHDNLNQLITQPFDETILENLVVLTNRNLQYNTYILMISQCVDLQVNRDICQEMLTLIESNTITQGISGVATEKWCVNLYSTALTYDEFFQELYNQKASLEEQDVQATWCVSEAFYHLEEISNVYQRTVEVSKQIFFKGSNTLFQVGNQKEINTENNLEHKLEQQLLDTIAKGNKDEALLIAERLLEHYVESGKNIQYTRYCCFKLCNALMTRKMPYIPSFQDAYDEKKAFEQIFAAENLMKLTMLLKLQVSACVEHLVQLDQTFSPSVEKTIHYIEQHYMEDLSLADIANAVYLSAGYLSNIFKNETKYTIYEYITQVRMEKAKELLQGNPTLKVKDISIKVGYNNVQSFVRHFKKYFGSTPKEIRGK